jgi:hypothetical protein
LVDLFYFTRYKTKNLYDFFFVNYSSFHLFESGNFRLEKSGDRILIDF